MAILSDYFEPKLLDHIFIKSEYTRSSALYLGISTTAFTESDNGITAAAKEPGYNSSGPTYFGDSYARVQIDNKCGYVSTADKIKNTSGIDFAEAGGSGWGNIAYWAIFDGASSTDNMLMHGSFSASVTVASGSQFRISSGSLEISFPTILNNAHTTGGRQWRAQTAYLMGFDDNVISSGDQFKFKFATDTTSGFDDHRLYLGVSASAFPTGAGFTSVENTGTNYARVQFDGTNFGSATTSGSVVTTISNTSAIAFPEAASDWGDMAYWAIFRGGNAADPSSSRVDLYSSTVTGSKQPLLMGSLSTSKTVNSGDVLRFGIGDFVITAS
jgi:hypothetical protein